MKKKIAAIVLSVLCLSMLLSVAAFAADPETHSVTATNDGNGSCGVINSSSVAVGTEVSVNTKPNSGYELAEIVLTRSSGGSGEVLSGSTFTMPAENVTVKAYFIPVGHRISRVDVTVDAIIGRNVLDTLPTTETAGVSISEDKITWFRYPTGGNIENAEPVAAADVFEEGYTYACCIDNVNVNDDYRYAGKDTKLYMNGEEIGEAKGGKDLGGCGILTPKAASTDKPVTKIEVEIAPVLGKKVLSTEITLDTDPADSVGIEKGTWYKYPVGEQADDTQEKITDPDEVFQKEYKYIYHAKLSGLEGYAIQDGVEVLIDGKAAGTAASGTVWIEPYLTPVEAPAEPTAAPTATPTAAPTAEPTASSTPKTGDSDNVWLYAFVGVLALGAMGVVALKKKADR